MLTGGPVMSYLKRIHNHKTDAVFMTGYQADETNGKLLLDTGSVFIDGRKIQVNCIVKQFDFSAHDGQSDLKKLIRKIQPKSIFFVHGEDKSVQTLCDWADALGIKAYGPKVGETIELE
jgi:putative mRNA 3-end processing factor